MRVPGKRSYVMIETHTGAHLPLCRWRDDGLCVRADVAATKT